MSGKIKKRHIYWDLKDYITSPSDKYKAKVAGRPLEKLDVYGFFEITSGRYVSEHLRVDIERHHIEKLPAKYLRKPDGCVKIEAEILNLADVLARQTDPANGFQERGRLCVDKWEELMQKVQSTRLRTGRRPWGADKQSLIIQLTQPAPDVQPVLERLKLA